MSDTAARPIGVFDSGVGGLSVLRAIRAQLPAEHVIYVADSAHIPYGEKPAAYVEARAHAIAGFLLARGAKALVVACNTATGAAVASLRARFPVPIVGTEPALKPAAARTRSGVVGVLATSGTLASGKFAALLERFGRTVAVHVQPCPGWVERVEAGDLASADTRALIARDIAPLLARGADALVLGCTHFPFLAPLIAEIAGPDVAILDPSAAIALELERRLAAAGLRASGGLGEEAFWTSGEPARVGAVAARLLGRAVTFARLPDAPECLDASALPSN